jgi:hypothetical protein
MADIIDEPNAQQMINIQKVVFPNTLSGSRDINMSVISVSCGQLKRHLSKEMFLPIILHGIEVLKVI